MGLVMKEVRKANKEGGSSWDALVKAGIVKKICECVDGTCSGLARVHYTITGVGKLVCRFFSMP